MTSNYNKLYKPLVEDPESGTSSTSAAPAAGLKSYAPSETRCGKLGHIARKIFCCCGLCEKIPGCAGLGEKYRKAKGFLFQSSSVCHMAWLVCFLLSVMIFAILFATVLAQVDNPYN